MELLTKCLNFRDKHGIRQEKDSSQCQFKCRIILLRFKVVTEGGSGLPLLLNLVARDMSGCVPIFMRQKYPRTRFYKKGDFMLTPYHRLSWHCDSQIKGY